VPALALPQAVACRAATRAAPTMANVLQTFNSVDAPGTPGRHFGHCKS